MELYNQIFKNLPSYSSPELRPYLQKVNSSALELAEQIKNNQMAPLNVVYQEQDLKEITSLAASIIKSFKKVVFLGVGGSSLGGKALTAIVDSLNNSEIEIIFLESIDVNTIKKRLCTIDPKSSFFVVVSKSGETIETICQTLIILDKFKYLKIPKPQENFIFITQNHESTIAKIALNIGAKIYNHPNNIGGRFSYLTIVGLLPAAIMGLDILKIRSAARAKLEDFIAKKFAENEISKICALRLYLWDRGFINDVVMPYIDNLKDFTDWYRQLWAESLGKKGFGGIPINSMGTVDQHSQLQLYLDGPRDKFFTFIVSKNYSTDFEINDLLGLKTRFGGSKLSDVVALEHESTIEILSRKALPIRIFELERLDESTLSSLMMQMFLEVILLAKVKNINPFDQPAVEMRKILAQELAVIKKKKS